ncbi:MAG: sulfurtransferase TusA family protein [Candidatus Bathyarchaeota archaeon]|nr:sulfurtransferase TusA family protein [Candidatus Bathyarchaeota archaeon]
MATLSVEKIDVKGKMCPIPVALTKRKLAELPVGALLEVTGEGELEFDNISHWVTNNGHEVVGTQRSGAEFKLLVKKR